MLFRTKLKAGFAACLLAAAVLGLTPAVAQDGSQELTYKQRLVFGLQARRPTELDFVDAVVDTVNRGELPRKLVDRTFFWARDRSRKQGGKKARRPIIYFQPALSRQAEKLGIQIRVN